MQLDQITIAGVTRFADPVTLDLTEIPEGSLVAIVGENGEGKTTLLDSVLAPLYLLMVSRRGKLATYATGERSVLEGIYRLAGETIRARVAVDGKRRETKAVLEVSTGEGGRLVTDGGVKAYQAEIARRFPPLELALASAFAPQNRVGSFVTATSAERKALFSTCLGLEQYAQWSETAAKAVQVVRTTIARLDGRRESLAQISRDELKADLLDRLEAAVAAQAERHATIQTLDRRRGTLLETRARLGAELEDRARAEQAAQAAQEAATRAAAAGVTLLRNRDERLAEVTQTRETVHQSHAQTLKALEAAGAKARSSRAEAVADPEKRIAANKALQERATEIRAAATARRAAQANVDADRLREREYQTALDEATEALAVDQKNLDPLETAEAKLEDARRQVEILEKVPCGGRRFVLVNLPQAAHQGDRRAQRIIDDLEGVGLGPDAVMDGSVCRFLTDAQAAGGTIQELEERVLLLPTARKARDARLAVIAGLRQSLGATRREIEAELATVRAQTYQADFEPELEKVEERVKGYRAVIHQADKVLAERLLELEGRRTEAGTELAAAVHELANMATAIGEAFDVERLKVEAENRAADDRLLAASMALERTAGAKAELEAADAEVERIATELRTLVADAGGFARTVENLEADLAAVALHRRELAHVEGNLETARQEVLVWETLARCFSRDGLPTLEIGNAGPTVSSLTNELLEIAFGPRFTVEVVTQVPTADGKAQKEEFTIRVYDNQDAGAVRDIADLSGGERVLVEEALRAAIMVFVNAQNRTPFRTICRDETTGALDPENAVRYVAMLRRLVGLAGAAHCLFITHNPQCAELADVVVTVADGRLDVRRTAA